jgi:hypothetical protein
MSRMLQVLLSAQRPRSAVSHRHRTAHFLKFFQTPGPAQVLVVLIPVPLVLVVLVPVVPVVAVGPQ